MGLDSVELVLATEEAFGISLSDEEVGLVRTPRQLIDLIATKLPAGDERSCLSQRAFYRLRKLLMQHFSLPRASVHLHSNLGELVPTPRHREFWETLARQLDNTALPPLIRPRWMTRTIWGGAGVALAYGFQQSPAHHALWGLAALAITAYTGFALTSPWKKEIPHPLRHVKKLVHHLILLAPGTFKQTPDPWSREHIAEVVQQLVFSQTRASAYDEDWDFIQDFGLD